MQKSFFLAITKEYLVSCKTGLNPSLNQTTCLNQLNSDNTKKIFDHPQTGKQRQTVTRNSTIRIFLYCEKVAYRRG